MTSQKDMSPSEVSQHGTERIFVNGAGLELLDNIKKVADLIPRVSWGLSVWSLHLLDVSARFSQCSPASSYTPKACEVNWDLCLLVSLPPGCHLALTQ